MVVTRPDERLPRASGSEPAIKRARPGDAATEAVARFRPGTRLLRALKEQGLDVNEVPDWLTRRTRGPFQPVGIMLHDTVRPDCLEMIVEGRAGVPGPLANVLIAKNGRVHLVSANRSHHAGHGSEVVLEEVRAGVKPPGDAISRNLPDTKMGNSYFYAIEVDNRSDGHDPYPDVQLEALVRCCLAIRKLHPEWRGFREIHHRQWTSRKRDMSYRGDIADAVAKLLNHGGRAGQ